MAHASWGPGWPNCQTGKIKTLVRSDGLRLPIREELHPLVAFLIDETERRMYDVIPGWTWGFACRAIRGSKTKGSNHSTGTAIDLNAPRNGMNTAGPGWQRQHSTGHTDMPQWLVPLWEAHGFRSGMNYTGRQDPMHKEFMLSVADAKRLGIDVGQGSAPGQNAGKLPLKVAKAPVYSDLAAWTQALINNWIDLHNIDLDHLVVDGKWGQTSGRWAAAFTRWVRRLQKAFGKPVWPGTPLSDRNVGPIKYGALQFFSAN